jgi:arsenate reductase
MNLLFICTHNRCRSILCQAITHHFAGGRIAAYSAGSQPSSHVHPLTIKYLQQRGIATKGLQSQSWNDASIEAISFDVVSSVCDNAAKETCPVWFGNAVKVHWGLPDPSAITGSDSEIEEAFWSVMNTVEASIRGLLAVDFESLSRSEFQAALQALAEER